MTVGILRPAGKGLDPGAMARLSGALSSASLRHYWRLLVRRKLVIGGTIALAMLIGLAATLLATRQYTATVLLEISRQRDSVIDVKDTIPRSPGIDLEFYQTQYSLLKARSLAERVANSLNLAGDERFFAAFRIAPRALDPPPGVPDDPLARRTWRQKIAVKLLLAHVTIAPIRASALANISFSSPDRLLSSRIANAWAGEFIEANLQRRFDAAGYARTFLERRLVEVRQRLEDSERQVVQYAAEQHIVDVMPDQATSGSSVSERSLSGSDLERVSTLLTQATADRMAAASRMKVEGLAAASVADDQTLVTLRQKRAEAATQYADMQAKFTPAYPPALALAAQITTIDGSIRLEQARVGETLAGQYRGARAREAALEHRVGGLKQDVLDLRRRAIQYNIYQRDVDTNRELYNGLLQRYKEIGIAGGVGTNNISIADPATAPDVPSSPRLFVNLFIALLVGAVAAAASVFALEQVDETVKDPADVAQVTSLPLLGVVPDSERIDPILALGDPKSAITEAYLSVQTSLGFSTDHGVPRSIAVTSTRAEEGKSATAFALAHSLVRTRRWPVLIDADLRSPSIHSSAGLANVAGVSNFLAGDDDLAALVHIETAAGFAVMTAGPNPPNAAELLTSDRLATLIARLLEDYDHVVVDSPPILGLADAPLIASAVEGVVYIIEANGARAGMIRSALHRLRNANAHVIGAVLTRFNPKRTTYDYGYGYGDDYGSYGPPRGAVSGRRG